MSDPPKGEGVSPFTLPLTVDSYARAFPEVDEAALAAHLAVTTTARVLIEGIEATIQSLGFGLTRPRYTIIRAIYLSPDNAVAQSELAQILGVTGPNVTQLIDGLASEGWVERAASPTDRRVVLARLTPTGQERAAKLVPAVLGYMRDSCSQLTAEEQHELQRLLAKVRASVADE